MFDTKDIFYRLLLIRNVCLWEYDGFGRVVESSDPDMGYSRFVYNAFGEVESVTDSLDRTTEMTYDRLGRLYDKTLPGSEGVVEYRYDEYTGSTNALGRVVRIDDPAQTKVFSYDRMGRIDRETRFIKPEGTSVSSGSFETEFEYDLLNRKRTILYPTDPKTGTRISARYKYASTGVTEVSVYNSTGRKEIISGVLYNEFGQMTEVARGNGTSTHYEYDIKGRLANLVTFTQTNDQTRKLQDVSYTFKIDGSIASTVNTPDLDTDGGYHSMVRYDYAFDGLNRLIKAQGNYARSSMAYDPGSSPALDSEKQFERGYAYAANGNMAEKNIYDPETHSVTDSRTYVYYNGNHAVSSVGSSSSGDDLYTIQYDAVGNMVQYTPSASGHSPLAGGATSLPKVMEYDSSNRLVRVTNPDAGNELIGRYWYDDQGFRVRKVGRREVSGQTRDIEVIYPSMYFGIEKHRTTAGAAIPDTDYAVNNIYLDGVRIAAVIPGGDARYYLTDQVDSVKTVVDDNGLPVSRMEYLPYGDTWFTEGDENNAPKYNSQELDKETNFYYYNARHYNAEVSRFVTPDTVIDGEFDTQGWNRYAYVKGNPIVNKDPTGHDSMVVVSNEIHTKDKNTISEGAVHAGEKFNTYKGYIYKDTTTLFGLITGLPP